MVKLKLKIGSKIIATNGVILTIMTVAMIFMHGKLTDQAAIIEDQALTLNQLETVYAVDKSISAVSYWYTDLAVSLLNESEDNANMYIAQTDSLLSVLETAYPQKAQEVKKLLGSYAEVMLVATDAYADDNRVLGNARIAEGRGTALKIKEIIDGLARDSDEAARQAGMKVFESIKSIEIFLIVLVLSVIAIGIFISWYSARSITRPLKKVVSLTKEMNLEFNKFVDVVDAVAENDMTKQVTISEISDLGIKSDDEIGWLALAVEGTLNAKNQIGQSLNKMTSNLNKVIRRLGDNANQVATAATKIASSAEQMSKGSQDQSNMVTQVSTAIEEITATIVESSSNSTEASQSAQSAAETATEGGQIVSDTIVGMQRIAQVVSESSESIGKLATSADQIGEIISVIDDIADQTNLLALNAAIEAARAGEQGRGFAVVADEVRKLAERTSKATGEITQMIKGIQQETKEAVASMETGSTEVENGRLLTDKAGNSLSEIVTMSESVMNMIQQIASASVQQTDAAEEIAKNIDYISNISAENRKGAEESSEASIGLSRQAEELKSIVEHFKV